VILDDRFGSILRAVLWGRSVYDNVQKFLQFQLTVNVVALVITFLAAVLQHPPPLNPVMMLWVNLIMDTMGTLRVQEGVRHHGRQGCAAARTRGDNVNSIGTLWVPESQLRLRRSPLGE
jgi:hypothetical protein